MEFRALNQAVPRKGIVKRHERLIDICDVLSEYHGIAAREIDGTA